MKVSGITAALKAVNNNQSELARRLSISPQSVQAWTDKDSIPLKRILEVERVTGVNRAVLDPKHYGQAA